MKFKILALSALYIAISSNVNAQYSINIPLEGNKIIFEDPVVTGTINLTQTTINRGESSNIVWNYTYADEINIENVGTYNSLTGSKIVSPLESTDYNILIKSGDKSKNEVLHLIVNQPNQNINFNADTYRIGHGTSTKLNWNVSNAESISIDNGLGSQSLIDSQLVNPLNTTTYTLTAKGYTGINDASQSLKIVVVPDANINSFSVDKDKISVGETSIFAWNVLNAEQLSLNGETVNNTMGTKPVVFSTAGSFPYVLQTTSLSGTITNSQPKIVNVYNPPFIDSLTATPNVVDAGQPVTLAFNTSDSVYNEINGINMNSNSTYVVNPTTTTTYTLLSRNPANKEVTKDVIVTVQGWSAATPVYGDWTNVAGKVKYNCGKWTPEPSTVTTNTTFVQTSTCSTDQIRTRQDRLVSNVTGELKNTGPVINETNTISESASRSYGVTLSAWTGSTVSSCASWTPDTNTYQSGQSFTQTGLNCTLAQTRTRTENYIDHLSGDNIQVSVVNQNQNIMVNGTGYTGGTRSATGTKIVQECYAKSTAYQWTYGQIGPQPSQMGTHIVWASTVVLHQIGYGPSSSVNIGSYNYTTNGSNVCRKPL